MMPASFGRSVGRRNHPCAESSDDRKIVFRQLEQPSSKTRRTHCFWGKIAPVHFFDSKNKHTIVGWLSSSVSRRNHPSTFGRIIQKPEYSLLILGENSSGCQNMKLSQINLRRKANCPASRTCFLRMSKVEHGAVLGSNWRESWKVNRDCWIL